MAGHRPPRRDRPRAGTNPPGSHALADHLATRLVRQSPVGPHDLVFDLGAGLGAITAPLARTGARVIAVERDPRLAARLTRRLAEHPNVSVVTGDALAVPLPHRPYLVVANVPFSITTALLRRLLATPLTAADLVIAHGHARLLTAARPARAEILAWQATFTLTRGQLLPAASFRPPPSVDATVLKARRRPQPPPPTIFTLLRHAYRTPSAPIAHLVGRSAARSSNVDPQTPISALTTPDWLRLATTQPTQSRR